ncbi:MAG: ABC transporter permease [Flavobacteriaceae bacterium]|jgi:putative ABC transport system permease protein|uniref:ABC transporter permease n=1 Tax=Flagellimonas sp. SN16 TaxID=3415142 RepID=UPI003C5E2EAB|nr:ABC transporter permease [Flavobacteriaceae bacterium]
MNPIFLKIATRYLLKNRLYSFINILGLTVGIASFVLIMLYVNYERSYDTFSGSEHVYRVYMDYMEGDAFAPGDAQVYNLSGPTIKQEFPEVLEQVRLYHMGDVTLVNKGTVLGENIGSLADPSYFDIFPYPLIKGDKNTALEEPYSIILNESLAHKLFGDENPLGKTVSTFWGNEAVMTVTGVMKDIPRNTHMKNSFLISFDTLWTWEMFQGQQELNWGQNNFFTYLKVAENSNIAALRKKIQENNADGQDDERHNIEALERIHLYSNKPYEAEANGSANRVNFLSAIALIVLLLSWLNYINLATAKSLERAKEIGIRKVAGAQRLHLVWQIFSESILINGFALILALSLVALALPWFNSYMGQELMVALPNLYSLWPFFVFILLGTIISNIYPAFILSGYRPAKTLKGKIQGSSQGLLLRKGLITVQFLATIVLLIGTLVVGKQIRFLKNQPIGAQLNGVVALKGQILDQSSDSLKVKDFQVLKEELANLSFVNAVSTAETYPGGGYDNLSSFMGITKPDGSFEEQTVYYQYQVQPDFFKVMGISFLAGDVFHANANGYGNDIVVNEQFAKKMGFSNATEALEKEVKYWGQTWKIVGVMENYHHFGLKTAIQPLLVRPGTATSALLVKLDDAALSSAQLESAMASLQSKWKSVFPESTFGYTFLDKNFEAQYNDDKKFGEAFGFFTFLAILIALMGLFGLTSYTILQRRKEIGIRKVNGATMGQILSLLNQDFVKWIGLAFIFAVPISWFAMNRWLEGFAYKTTINWWIFALTGFLTLFLTLLTVSFQSIRAASANPVETLREE